MNWIFVIIVLLLAQREFMASPTPLKLPGHTQKLTPYIKHWEAANFDRECLNAAHQKHIEQKHQRRKRDLSVSEFGRANTIRLKFNAHDREFRLVLHQDPLSVFAGDVQIENTQGPINYDISRIYTGSLEDYENSHVHAVLTDDNLLDGTIETNSEHFYLEPAHRYSQDLFNSGVHSIVYKLSDVNMKQFAASLDSEHCASDQLHRSTTARQKRWQRNTAHEANTTKWLHRYKRWLPDEFSTSGEDHQYPPLPLDLGTPYNDGINKFSHITNRYPMEKPTTTTKFENKIQRESVITWQNIAGRGVTRQPGTASSMATIAAKTNHVQNSRDYEYSPNRDNYRKNNGRNNDSNDNNNNNGDQNPYVRYKNIYMKNISRSSNNQSISSDERNQTTRHFYDNVSTYNPFSNDTIRYVSNDRPSHKTHVEIITKNGATKKPNIIINNYNPDIMLAPNLHNPNFKSMTNFLIGRGQEAPQDSESTTKSVYDRKITCMLYLQADHTFFQKMGSDEASIEAITRHVQRANSIYKNTDFNRDGIPDNITFMIKRIKVHNMNAINDPTYRFPGNYGVEKFLELFSEEDYDAFCLAYMFTYRDFEMGTLGLAWTGDLKNAGGVCEKNGHYRGSLKSLNTGIVTLLNYGKHVPPAVSHVTLAHEIGHNFGSPHDPDQCTPGGEDGNFIMFARATSGDKKNNHRFSSCSLKSIDPVLSSKARSTKGCFTEPQTSICGNGVVETGEQCDCGWEEDCKDSCCFPMSRHYRIDEKPCTLTPSAMCSPSQGPCCTTDCKLKFGDKCRDDNGCRDPSFCDGGMPQCPPSLNKPNKTICNKEFVCYMGECTGSICLAYGLESCQCIPGQKDDKIKSCELCCKLPGEGNPCRSSFEWNEPPFDVPDMYAKPGTPCNDYNGYCDVFQKCREVDPSGPLATLRKLLLSEESIATFKKWMQQNWYTVAFAVFGVVLLLMLSTKLLAKRSNLKLKSVTIIHSATTETVRLPEDNNEVIVHTAVRTKVPFKKKVRGERIGSKGKTAASGKTMNPSKAYFKSIQSRSRGVKVAAPTLANVTSPRELQKSLRDKNNRIRSIGPSAKATTVAAAEKPANDALSNELTSPTETKSSKKLKRNNKEVIDYSANNTFTTARVGGSYTNTFSKVQKWLLESPIVAQPLSRIEHSSKMMSKSQSTPEWLLQKSPQKSKTTGNVSKEKVKLQVVYKPPFRFALRMSKTAKVKTHVVNGSGGGTTNAKRQSKVTGMDERKRLNKSKSAESKTNANGNKKNHVALVVRPTSKDNNDHIILPLSEPNYETLNPKTPSTQMESPVYENNRYIHGESHGGGTVDSLPAKVQPTTSSVNKGDRSSGRMNAGQNSPSASDSSTRPNSMSANSQFASTFQGSLRQPEVSLDSSINNFSSTQNLIKGSRSDLAKTKRRAGLKLNMSKNNKEPPPFQMKRSSSNTNLRHDTSASSIRKQEGHHPSATASSSVVAARHSAPLRRNSSSTTSQQQMQRQQNQPNPAVAKSAAVNEQQLLYPASHSARNNFNNIPRVSISNSAPASSNNSVSNLSFNGQLPPNVMPAAHAVSPDISNRSTNSHNRNSSSCKEQSQLQPAEQRRSRMPLSFTAVDATGIPSAMPHQCSNSIRKPPKNHHPPPVQHPTVAVAETEREALSNLEVMVSDLQNLVS